MANQPHPDKVAINLRIWRDLRDRAKKYASDHGETLTDLIERLLEAEVSREQPITETEFPVRRNDLA